jgi:hypothetical protein
MALVPKVVREKIPMSTRKNFSKNYWQFGHAVPTKFTSNGLDGYDGYEEDSSGMLRPAVSEKLTDVSDMLTACIFNALRTSHTSVSFYDSGLQSVFITHPCISKNNYHAPPI